jgi:hypothetical protein
MKKFKRVMFFILLGVSLYISGYKINSGIREIKWHNAGHTPTMNGEVMKKVGDYFLAESTNKQFSVYVSRNFIEANKYCRVCQEKESVLYRIFTALGIVKEQPKTLKSNLCESDYGITVN